jgi:hypothetical protein
LERRPRRSGVTNEREIQARAVNTLERLPSVNPHLGKRDVGHMSSESFSLPLDRFFRAKVLLPSEVSLCGAWRRPPKVEVLYGLFNPS